MSRLNEKNEPLFDYTERKTEQFQKVLKQYQTRVDELSLEEQKYRSEIKNLMWRHDELKRQADNIIKDAQIQAQARADDIVQKARTAAQAQSEKVRDAQEQMNLFQQSLVNLEGELKAYKEALDKRNRDLQVKEDKTLGAQAELDAAWRKLDAEYKTLEAKDEELLQEHIAFDNRVSAQNAELDNREEALARRQLRLNEREAEVDQRDQDLRKKADEVAKGTAALSALQAREAALVNRESKISAREAEVDDRFRKSEANMLLAHRKEKDAAILDLRARRTLDEIKQKEAVLRNLNIPVK